MKTTILERIYKRLLKESGVPNVSNLGAYKRSGSLDGEIISVAYNIDLARKILTDEPELFENKEAANQRFLNEVIVGMVSIRNTKDPCWGAKQIAFSAGPGKLVYGMAYALSPNGRLISDRGPMSDSAIAAWKNMSVQGTRSRLELDNVKLPKEQRKTPDLPDDDCRFRDEDFLNYAYESEDWEKPMFETMVDNHKGLIAEIPNLTYDDGGDESIRKLMAEARQRYFIDTLRAAGDLYFVKRYDASWHQA